MEALNVPTPRPAAARRTPLSPPDAAPGSSPPAPLVRAPGAGLAEQLAQRLAESIRLRVLGPGSRLPSVRQAAQRHGLSTATVVAAYDRLQAQGLIEARPQRGFFVRHPDDPGQRRRSPITALHEAAAAQPPVDATALIRGMFRASPGRLSPGIGTLPEEWLDADMLRRALRRATQGSASSALWLGYGEPAGDRGLREAMSQHLETLGVSAPASQIVTTVGATHGLDIVSRCLLKPGDAVLVDEPGWAIEFARLQRLGVCILPVPRGPQGPQLDTLEALCRSHQPRLYVTVSVLHNPTGASLSAASAHRILQLADEHDFTVVEDDSYAWLAEPHVLRLSALDGLRRTVLVSGFSKIAAPQWRVGCVAAHPALAERLVDSKLLSTLTSPALLEQALAHCLQSGELRRHAERVRQRLAVARQRCVRMAEQAGCRFAAPPDGLFGWVDTGVDTDRLALLMHEHGWLVAPGSLFHAVRHASPLMRINFASTLDARFWRLFEGMRALV
jgi:DNA-binding transcriptional MocR family regulator